MRNWWGQTIDLLSSRSAYDSNSFSIVSKWVIDFLVARVQNQRSTELEIKTDFVEPDTGGLARDT